MLKSTIISHVESTYMYQASPEKQNQQKIRQMIIEIDSCNTEARMFYNSLSAGQRTRKTSDIIQPELENLIMRGADGVNPSQSLKAQEPGLLMFKGSRKWMSHQICPSLSFWFYSSPQWIGCLPVLVRVVFVFIQFTDSFVNLFRKHPRYTQKFHVLPALQASLSPVKLTNKINQHSTLDMTNENEILSLWSSLKDP